METYDWQRHSDSRKTKVPTCTDCGSISNFIWLNLPGMHSAHRQRLARSGFPRLANFAREHLEHHIKEGERHIWEVALTCSDCSCECNHIWDHLQGQDASRPVSAISFDSCCPMWLRSGLGQSHPLEVLQSCQPATFFGTGAERGAEASIGLRISCDHSLSCLPLCCGPRLPSSSLKD